MGGVFGLRLEVEPFQTDGEGGEQGVVVHVQVVFVLFVVVDLELADFVFRFGGQKQTVGWKDSKLLGFALTASVDVSQGWAYFIVGTILLGKGILLELLILSVEDV